MIDRTLDNRYTILERVGGGGMADVYRAHDRLLDRSVAVKVLRPQFTDDEEFVTRFRREAQAAARLSHPNIVNIYDVGRDGDSYYIVMEYISGETLKERILREGPLPVENAVRIALEIAEAVTWISDTHLEDEEYALLREHLTDDQVSLLTWSAITINTFNRVSIMSRYQVRPH